MGKVLDSIVKEWKEKGLDDHPLYDLLVHAANEYADDPEFDSLVQRVITEAPLCTCKSLLDDQLGGPQADGADVIGLNYRGFDPLLHEEQCPLHSGQRVIIDDTVT
ncbi:MAG TPA: hypothetical protein VJ875_02760 [Pyrinomonadaceae bacterium]|nr:hypothetical protein [Pyrinomonadaceae bacterium]